MSDNRMTITYRIPEPFERALSAVREVVANSGLSVTVELDVSRRIRREFGIALAPCRILCVDHPQLLLQAMALDGSAAVWLPLHVAVTGYGPQTVVHILRSGTANGGDSSPENPVNKTRIQLSRALEKIAMSERF